MQKTCPRCRVTLNLSEFARRAASKDGHSAACRFCLATAKRDSYASDTTERLAAISRATRTKRERFEREPEYRRAFVLWGSTKRRTKIPPWVRIADFLPVCRQADALGDGAHIDHIIPLKHPLVCGLHTPNNVRALPKIMNLMRRTATLSIEELNAI